MCVKKPEAFRFLSVISLCYYLLNPAVAAVRDVRGLPGLDLDAWTGQFFSAQTSAPGGPPTPVGASVLAKIKAATGIGSVLFDVNVSYGKLLALRIARPGMSRDEFNTLIQALFSARMAARAHVTQDETRARKIMLLLGMLGDEAIHALNIQKGLPAPGENPEIKVSYLDIPKSQCTVDGRARTAKLNGITICQGDVLISKGAAGSSSFLARFADEPGYFSHSTIAYVAPGTGTLVFPEAFIEDGLKLRTPDHDYVQDRKRKLAIYRLKNPAKNAPTLAAAVRSVDAFKAEMEKRVADPTTEAAFPYDFGFVTEGAVGGDAYFCSEVAYQVYRSASGVADSLNPYPASFWSRISGVTSEFFRDFLTIETGSFPAPSDVELNPAWDLVAYTIHRGKIAEDRIDVAMIDALLSLLTDNPELAQKIIAAGKKVPDQKLTHAQVMDLAKSGYLTDEQVAMLDHQVPEQATLRQLLFFGGLNGFVTPEVRKAIAAQESQSLELRKRPLGPNEMRAAMEPILQTLLKKVAAKLAALGH